MTWFLARHDPAIQMDCSKVNLHHPNGMAPFRSCPPSATQAANRTNRPDFSGQGSMPQPPLRQQGRGSSLPPSRYDQSLLINTALHSASHAVQPAQAFGTHRNPHRFSPCFQHLIDLCITAQASPGLPRFPLPGATRTSTVYIEPGFPGGAPRPGHPGANQGGGRPRRQTRTASHYY